MAVSSLLTAPAESWQMNEQIGYRLGAEAGVRLAPYTVIGGFLTLDHAAAVRVPGPAGLGYGVQLTSDDEQHLRGVRSGSNPAVQPANGTETSGFWIWAWVKFATLPDISTSADLIWKQSEFDLFLEHSGSNYVPQYRGFGEGTAAVFGAAVDTTDWHLIEAWFDPVALTYNVAWDGGVPGTTAVTGPGDLSTGDLVLGGLSDRSADVSICSPTIRKKAPTTHERDLLWNDGDGFAYPFGRPVVPVARQVLLDNTGGESAVAVGDPLPLFLPESYSWEGVYWANGDDLAAADSDGNPLPLYNEAVNKAQKFGRVWIPAPVEVPAGGTAPITLSSGNPARIASDDYDNVFTKRTADADTEALFHVDVITEDFDPADFSPVVWLKEAGLPAVDDPIATWANSGSGVDATLAFDTKPVCKIGLDGKKVCRRITSDQRLKLFGVGSDFPSAATLYIVATFNDTEYNLYATRNVDGYDRYSGDGNGYSDIFRSARLNAHPPSMPSTGNHYLTYVSSAALWQAYIDGAAQTSQSAAYAAGTDHTLGGGGGGGGFQGDLVEILAFAEEHDAGQIASMHGYLTARFPSLP